MNTSSRLLPRRRHRVPSWVPVLLGALFRYSELRNAWILRGIGERYGPVLVSLTPQRIAVTKPPARRSGGW
ncbi:MAG: hypothetical protein M3016_10070, partial [Actinomycetota bacterium]|nr:hypothetical protein [Actinomycetota bacterium]